ncbi:hypothetical protein FMM49_32485 [Streptomyces rimosus subsp. rimosus]|nr:hypothetical protein FMM49_32485 [Streptomyces rimosus subsp. rimosus]
MVRTPRCSVAFSRSSDGVRQRPPPGRPGGGGPSGGSARRFRGAPRGLGGTGGRGGGGGW